MPVFNYLAHKKACESKQASRSLAISSLPSAYHSPLTSSDRILLNTPIYLLSSSVRSGAIPPLSILHAFGRRALAAHQKTNCLTEILLPSCERWIEEDQINFRGSLAGVPVSLKDTVNVTGYDSCIGYSKWVNRPAEEDAPLIRLLRDAGAIPFVKTNVPITLLSFESTNPVFGRTDNPHVPGFSPGGSTGGEAALLALGGSRLGIGTDVAGSVRVPAAWSGIYTIRCSTGRFPRTGGAAAQAGQEGVPAVYSPMTRTLEDLKFFLKAVIDMKPWTYDYSVHPLTWRGEDVEAELELHDTICWGVLRDDGVVSPTPAIARALDETVEALRKTGDEVVELDDCPSCFEALLLATRLLNADSCETTNSHFQSVFEANDPGVQQLLRIFGFPRWIKKFLAFYHRYIRRDPILASFMENLHNVSVAEQWRLVVQREATRREWFEYLQSKKVDFILTPANALPAIPAGGMRKSIASCGYTFVWNLLDYSAGVLPIGKVDPERDRLEKGWKKDWERSTGVKMNGVMRRAWGLYNAEKMKGLPTAVQVVGGRLEEEKVLWGMERVVEALDECGIRYNLLEID